MSEQKTIALDYRTWRKLQTLKNNKQQTRFDNTVTLLLATYEQVNGPIKEE